MMEKQKHSGAVPTKSDIHMVNTNDANSMQGNAEECDQTKRISGGTRRTTGLVKAGESLPFAHSSFAC